MVSCDNAGRHRSTFYVWPEPQASVAKRAMITLNPHGIHLPAKDRPHLDSIPPTLELKDPEEIYSRHEGPGRSPVLVSKLSDSTKKKPFVRGFSLPFSA